MLLPRIGGDHVIGIIIDELASWAHAWLVGPLLLLSPLLAVVLGVRVIADGRAVVCGLDPLGEIGLVRSPTAGVSS